MNSYKYVGFELTSNLLLNSQFEWNYCKSSGRLQLLNKLQDYLNQKSSEAIYTNMIEPIFTYCGLLFLKLNDTQRKKLNSIERRAGTILQKPVRGIENNLKRKACNFVHAILNDLPVSSSF